MELPDWIADELAASGKEAAPAVVLMVRLWRVGKRVQLDDGRAVYWQGPLTALAGYSRRTLDQVVPGLIDSGMLVAHEGQRGGLPRAWSSPFKRAETAILDTAERAETALQERPKRAKSAMAETALFEDARGQNLPSREASPSRARAASNIINSNAAAPSSAVRGQILRILGELGHKRPNELFELSGDWQRLGGALRMVADAVARNDPPVAKPIGLLIQQLRSVQQFDPVTDWSFVAELERPEAPNVIPFHRRKA